MSGCRSCSANRTERTFQPLNEAEKLEKIECSGNPRYPRVFVGKQAIYSDDQAQIIVNVVADKCDEHCDCFILEPQTILKDPSNKFTQCETFNVSQPVGDESWKLHALI
jgi:hypothetical protein